MLPSALLMVLALAPAPPPPWDPFERDDPSIEPVPGAPIQRSVDGPVAVPAPPEPEPEPAPEQEEPEPAPPPLPEVTEPVPAPRSVPRLLATIGGNPPDEDAVFVRGRVAFHPGLQVRNQIGWVSPFVLDGDGQRFNEPAFSQGRVRWTPKLTIDDRYTFAGTLDLANGRWAPEGGRDPAVDEIITRGHPPGSPSLQIVDPRELYFEARMRVGLLRVGQQAFTWGQGILANSGNYVDRFGDLRFGDDGRGDLYERVVFATKPFARTSGNVRDLVIGIGADLVFRDDNAALPEGDLAGQALLIATWRPEHAPGHELGGYLVYRHQRFGDDGDVYRGDDLLQVGVADLTGQGTLWLRNGLQLIGAFEATFLFGRTTVARGEHEAHAIAQTGAVARGYLGNHERWLVGFDAGYASGDANPNDRWIHNFTFDPGHTVGLLMFNQVLGWRTAQSEILATNGELIAVPENGSEFIPTRGGVTNAIYVQPKARYALWERLEIWGGPLFAAAPRPVVDPYATRLAGGVPTNSVGGDGDRRYYGTELDLGVRARFDLRKLWLQAGLQGGVLFPGPALADRNGDTGPVIGTVFFRTELRY